MGCGSGPVPGPPPSDDGRPWRKHWCRPRDKSTPCARRWRKTRPRLTAVARRRSNERRASEPSGCGRPWSGCRSWRRRRSRTSGTRHAARRPTPATVMKMADGGFRPAYNFQFATDTASQVIAGVAVETTGSDAGQMGPMVDQVADRSGKVPPEWLVDGGFAQHDQIDAVSDPAVGCTVYAPVPQPKDPQADRHVPKPGDSAAVATWRRRMGTEPAKAIYKERAATAECVNALARGRGLVFVLVRGVAKVKALALWYALAHNLLCATRLRAALAGQA